METNNFTSSSKVPPINSTPTLTTKVERLKELCRRLSKQADILEQKFHSLTGEAYLDGPAPAEYEENQCFVNDLSTIIYDLEVQLERYARLANSFEDLI